VYRVKDMYFHVNEKSNLKAPLIADDVYDIIMKVRDLGLHRRVLGCCYVV
jgi:hypothetical protein